MTMINDLSIPKHISDYRLEGFEGELLLYHPVKTQAVYLNETAALIWRLCDGRRSVEEIRSLLSGAYLGVADKIDQDLISTLEQFSACGAIEFL